MYTAKAKEHTESLALWYQTQNLILLSARFIYELMNVVFLVNLP